MIDEGTSTGDPSHRELGVEVGAEDFWVAGSVGSV